MNEISWTEIKTQSDNRGIPLQYTEDNNFYYIQLVEGAFILSHKLDKNPTDTTDKVDFETNYKPNANPTLTDGEGINVSRIKIAKKGWTYHHRAIDFDTSTLASLVNEDKDSADLGDASIKFYNSSDVELTTQGDCDTSCVKTVVEFEPSWDYELIGGQLVVGTKISQDYRAWMVAVPDLTPAQGGSKIMINNYNLRFVDPNGGVHIDGRTSKYLTYDAVYHTNKLQIIIRHPAGGKEKLMIALELYKQ